MRLGIDLGGSKVFAALLDGSEVIASEKRRTRAELGYAAVVERIVELVQRVCKEASIPAARLDAVGVGVPGPVVDDTLLHAPNLGWTRPPLAADLRRGLGVDAVRVGNDVNCGALGEARFGAARGKRSVFALFIGTGLGGGWVHDGQVHEGVSGFAGEVGHVQIPGLQAPCGCGQSGCLETVASKRGLERLLREARERGQACLLEDLERLRSKDIERAYREGCPSTADAFAAMARHLAWSMNAVAAILNPDVFVLGGGIGQRLGAELAPKIDEARAAASFVSAHGPYEIVVGSLGPAAVALGAAALR